MTHPPEVFYGFTDQVLREFSGKPGESSWEWHGVADRGLNRKDKFHPYKVKDSGQLTWFGGKLNSALWSTKEGAGDEHYAEFMKLDGTFFFGTYEYVPEKRDHEIMLV